MKADDCWPRHFERFYADDRKITDDRLAEPFVAFRPLHRTRARYERQRQTAHRNGAREGASNGYGVHGHLADALLTLALKAEGQNKAAMVEVAGIEPDQPVWIRRNPLVPGTKSRVPLGSVGTRWVRPLTLSTVNRASGCDPSERRHVSIE